MSVNLVHAMPAEDKDGIRAPGPGVTDSCEPPPP